MRKSDVFSPLLHKSDDEDEDGDGDDFFGMNVNEGIELYTADHPSNKKVFIL